MQTQLLAVVDQILMLFMLIAAGLFLRKRAILGDSMLKGINALIMTLTWPMLMIATTQKPYTPESLAIFVQILLASTLFLAAALTVLFLFLRKKKIDFTPTLSMLCVMPNSGFFGIPIVQALYGSEGLLYLSAYIIGFNLVLWTIPMVIYAKLDSNPHTSILKNLLNPGILCAILGISLFLLKIALPAPILGTVNALANTNTPLSMLILGARMDNLKLAHFANRKLWLCTALKLLALPLLALCVLRPLGIVGMSLTILVAATAMPTAASVQMMAERYGGDVSLSAKTISVTTLCSALSLPLILFVTSLFA